MSTEKQDIIDRLARQGIDLISTFKDKSGVNIFVTANDYFRDDKGIDGFSGDPEYAHPVKDLFNDVVELNDVEKYKAFEKILDAVDLINEFQVQKFKYAGGMADFWFAKIKSSNRIEEYENLDIDFSASEGDDLGLGDSNPNPW